MAAANADDTWRDMVALVRGALGDDRIAMDAILDNSGNLRDLAEMTAGFVIGVMYDAYGAGSGASREQLAKLFDAELAKLLTQGPPGSLAPPQEGP